MLPRFRARLAIGGVRPDRDGPTIKAVAHEP